MTTFFFLAASDAKVLSGSVTDPALLPSSSSRNARLSMSPGSNGLRLISQHSGQVFFHGTWRYQAPRQRSSPFFPEVHTSSRYYGTPGRAIHPSRVEPHLHLLDTPTRRLDKQLQRCTLWLCSRSSRPICSPVRKPVWMQLERDRPGSMCHQREGFTEAQKSSEVHVSYINHQGGLVSKRADKLPSCVGSEQSALTEGDTCARQNEPRSRHVVKEQCIL